MIPANIDHVQIIYDLNKWGIKDAKIEMFCGFSKGYVIHIKSGDVSQMIYARAARLYNFWFDEKSKVEPIQPIAATT